MKNHTKPRDTRDARDTCPPEPRLKAWKKSSLAREDYDFTPLANWPKEALNVGWLWELERELGSGRGPFYPAWQKWASHESKGKPEAPRERPPILRAYPLEQAARCLDKQDGRHMEAWPDSAITGTFAGRYTRIHALEIDWEKTEKQLVEAFRNWLRHGEHEFSPDDQFMSRRVKCQRNTAGFQSWLKELAIYRISVAGFDRKGAGADMLEKVGMLKTTRSRGELITSANWAHAHKRTLERLNERIQYLRQRAMWNFAWLKNESWKDYFTDMNAMKPREDGILYLPL